MKDSNLWMDILGLSPSEYINKGQKGVDRGKDFENKTLQELKDSNIEIVNAGKKYYDSDGNLICEVDIEVNNAIIEVTLQKGGKSNQVDKLVNNKIINPDGKPVILYGPNYKNRAAVGDVDKAGGLVVNKIDDLIDLVE